MGEEPLALLLEYLDASLQPTFVLHLLNEQEAVFRHANPALQRFESLYTEVIRQIQPDTSHPDNSSHKIDVSSLLQVCLQRSTISLCRFDWAVTIVGNRWLVAVTTNKHSSEEENNHVNTSKTTAAVNREQPSNTQAVTGFHVWPAGNTVQKPPLGAIKPHGHLGDLGYLNWMRQYDWTSSPIGPIEQWPAELRQICEYVLATPDPINILWGNEYTFLYNQAFSVIGGDKHPRAMGRPFKENFEQWPEYYGIFDRIRETGQPVQQDRLRRILVRDGFPEEAFFNFLLAPILGADGSVAGFTTRIHEQTQQVVFEQRMQILIDTSNAMAMTYTLHDLCRAAASVLDRYKSDIHFAAFYSTDFKDQTLDLVLEATVGFSEDRSGVPPRSDPGPPKFGLKHVLAEACRTQEPILLSTSNNSLTQASLNQFEEYGALPCREVVIHPLKCFVEDDTAAIVIVGLSPLRKYDEDYRSFLHLLTRQIENKITVARGMTKEKELHKAQVTSQFWRFAKNAPVGLYMCNSGDDLSFWNAAFEAIIGRSGQELAQPLVWLDTVHPDCIADILAIRERYTHTRCEEAITFEIQFKKPWTSRGEGVEVSLDRTWALGIVQPEYTKEGQLKGTLGCITDISSIKWAEQIQATRLSEAIEQKRQQENFLDVTSHEMRNPLNAIFQCAYELTENIKLKLKSSEPTRAQIEILNECLDLATTITYCASHQKRIVDDVLTLSKLDARLLQIYPESTNPIRLYRNILASFGPEIRASGMNTNFTVGTGYNRLELKRVMIDPNRVTQVVINLLSNAIKFTKKGKKKDLEMTIDAYLEEPANKPMGTRYIPSGAQHHDPTGLSEWGQGEAIYISFSVKDSGLGMTPEESSSLFQKFSQASPRTHAQFGGSGLGLYISRNLVELHGGRIGLRSQAGFGSTFEFYVKVRRSQGPEMPATQVDRPIPTMDLDLISPAMQQPPAVQSENQSALEHSTYPEQSTLPPRTNVLIVEDNLINQRLLRKLITRHCYDTIAANNGEEALAFIANSTWNPAHTAKNNDIVPTIDIVLCDIEMPIMDGKTCVRRVRQLQQEGLLTDNIPMIAITGNARVEQVEEMRQCGFDDVITKPYKVDQLLKIIERYVGGRDELLVGAS